MAASSEAQASSKTEPPCPRCNCNDNVSTVDSALSFASGFSSGVPYRDLSFDLAAADSGYIGKETDFCFFRIGGDTRDYVCQRRH
jgi:hypothetical protein